MSLIDISTVEEIFPYVLAAVLIFLIQFTINKWYNNEEMKKRRSIWIKFLRSNETINKCLWRFEQIESSEGMWYMISRLAGLFLGIFGTLVLSFILYSLFVPMDIFISNALAGFINIIPFTLNYFLWQYTSKRKEEQNLLGKAILIKRFYQGINWFIFGSSSFILGSILATYQYSDQSSISDLGAIRFIYFISILLVIANVIFLNVNFQRYFFGNLKSEINKLYVKDFPTIHISTNVETLYGKIRYIFDDDLIILDDEIMKGTQWNDIIVITINHNPVNETCQ